MTISRRGFISATAGGVLLGVPPLIFSAGQTAGITFGRWEIFALTLAMGLGGMILGINAKDKQVHSTAAQVQAATIDVPTSK